MNIREKNESLTGGYMYYNTTYKLFKSEFYTEPYVKSYLNRFHRSTFAKFRCGVLPIQIEVGRFRGQGENQRICPICKGGV